MANAQDLVLLAATVTTGIIAGLFFTYANSVMPALGRADDRAFVAVMQRINDVILNPLFLATFVGGLVLSLAAAVAVWQSHDRGALVWVVGGAVLYAAMFVITRAVNIPLNDELAEAGDVDPDGARSVRRRFEATWNTWNVRRAYASVGAFCCLAVALLAS